MSSWKTYSDSHYYFITNTITEWLHVCTTTTAFQLLIDALQFCIDKKGLHLHAYVIMPNHLHLIISSEEGSIISDIMRDFKSHTSKQLTSLLKTQNETEILQALKTAALVDGRENSYKVWQDGFHPIVLQSELFLRQKMEYLHFNPVRKGFVKQPEDWKYSSARNYLLDDHSIIKVECL